MDHEVPPSSGTARLSRALTSVNVSAAAGGGDDGRVPTEGGGGTGRRCLPDGGPALQRYPAALSRRTSQRSSATDVVKQRPPIIVSASAAAAAEAGRRLDRSRSVRSTLAGRPGVESVQLVTAEQRHAPGTEPDRITSRIRRTRTPAGRPDAVRR